MSKFTLKELAKKVLKEERKPLTAEKIWQIDRNNKSRYRGPDSSEILFPARFKSELDWDTINKLSRENDDFKEFVKRIKIDISSKEVRKERYDKVVEIEKLKVKLLPEKRFIMESQPIKLSGVKFILDVKEENFKLDTCAFCIR